VIGSLLNSSGGQALANIGQSIIGRASTANNAMEIINRLERGEFKLTVTPDDKLARQLRQVEAQGRRTTRAILAGSAVITSTLLYTHGDVTAAIIGYGISGVLLVATWMGGE